MHQVGRDTTISSIIKMANGMTYSKHTHQAKEERGVQRGTRIFVPVEYLLYLKINIGFLTTNSIS